MTQMHRLASGGLIDRARPLSFRFDGASLQGCEGDTLASALVANGVRLVGRSFKYHRPRGIFSAGPEEPNALVELRSGARREPNTRATVVPLYDGLEATSQNRWPSLRADLMAVNSLAAPILAAGFYYKTFMWPASFWEKLYEPLIRRAAGLGRAAREPDPDSYEKAHAFCDVLVIGGGPTGLAAAIAAGRSGARVILCDEDTIVGGRLNAESLEVGDAPGHAFAARAMAELASMSNVRVMARTTVFGAYDHGTYGAVERVNDHVAAPPSFEPRQRTWRIVARRAILATGAIERPLVFGGNDKPGVMQAGAVRAFLNRYAARPGAHVVLFANNDGAGRTIGDLTRAGVSIAAVVDPRDTHDPALMQAAKAAGAPVFFGAVARAHGGTSVQAVSIASANGHITRVACDCVAVSGGYDPVLHLASHQGGRPRWDEALAAFVPATLPDGMTAGGAAAGHFALGTCLADGAWLGAEAAAATGFEGPGFDVPKVAPETTGITPLWRVTRARGKAFVDFQNDVTAGDVALAEREGFRSVEHLKRYTTLGMATDQGKTSNVNGLAIMAEITAKSVPETGMTRFRPPYTPVTMGALAGHHIGRDLKPFRLTPAHDWAKEQGAVFMETGLWMRAQYFPKIGDSDWLDACNREVVATRGSVGFCDVSTLGKIDVQGPDAGRFLDFLYCNTMSTLAVGRVRYGLMLREDGFVFDDGTAARLGDTHFLVSTTTAHAAQVLQHMEFVHQALMPDLDVQFVSVSDQWAQFSIAGPRARAVIEGLLQPGSDVSNAAFPYMAAGPVTLKGGLRGRLFRISFSGELAYEIAAPARYGDALARAIMAAGEAFAIQPYGLEALSVMRIEKGHVGGGEMNGQTTARDIGLGSMMAKKKDFIGRAMAQRPALLDPDRPIFVGLRPFNELDRPASGAHLIDVGARADAASDRGYVTSGGYSPDMKRWLALGLLARGRERIGETVRAWDPIRGRDIALEVCTPVFLDPEGSRLRV